jgi:CDP-diacylglycerol--serine O-phosphatidyltransferase
MLQHILKPANAFTAASMFCGLYSVMWAAGAAPDDSHAFFMAGLLIVFAGIFDGLDGRIARLTKTESEFGVQLDSLVYVVSFGVAPGVLLYKWGLEAYGEWGFAVAFVFVICGTFRLARFNMHKSMDARGELPKRKKPDDPRYSEGLTITSAGGMVAVLVMHHAHVRAVAVSNHLAILVLTLFLAYLMVSTVRFRTWREWKFSPLSLSGIGAVIMTSVTVLAVYDWTAMLVFVGGTYIAMGPFTEAAFFAKRRPADDVYYLQEVHEDDTNGADEEARV